MTIIVARHHEAAGRAREPAQPYAGGTAQINPKRGAVRNLSRNSAAYQPLRMRAGGSDDRTLNRGGGVNSQFLPAPNFQSATSFLSRGVIPAGSSPDRRIAGGLLPIWRGLRLFESFPALMTAGRHVLSGLHSALAVRQNLARQVADHLHGLSYLLRCVSEHSIGVFAACAKSLSKRCKR